MHEMSYMVSLLTEASVFCEENHIDGATVDTICVEVGEMTGVLPEFLYKYFPEASGHTEFSGARLEVSLIPTEIECAGCKSGYHPERSNDYSCPKCGSHEGRIINGRECSLASLKLKD